ncbi:right-handed parallel beta-helix repeat-containing protein [Aquimarina sp. U1-2]|uniref:right-handed parallel beta-helix repeat-containing protein n=1 Tax=Aquimarina sp. U1-2 TaxID=2823141 RepID=UPI001AECA44C|nr:right-handed parallel beta-helix repeat-containing protein [Aquimarina sp. U1-2]MBP2832012.1 right-handed parallel beta-helix repeat-containing protein [Aquimarina sp. U1-2]
MKLLNYFLLSAGAFLLTSCSSENFEEVVPDAQNFEQSENTVTTPCSFDAIDIEANSKVIIDCVLDLNGEVITLPENVIFEFNKGDIINGTLIFSGDENIIDGRILNGSLTLEGNVALTSPTFNFYGQRWNMIEGKTTDENALTNRQNLNKAIETVKRLGGNVFEINKLNAYFNVGANKVNRKYHSERSIRVPSNFHLKMSENTFLRVQPTHFPSYSLLTTYVTDNSVISGGNLIGDRWEHDYSPIVDIAGVSRNEHEWGTTIYVIGSHGLIVDGVTIREAIGDGITVHAKTIRTPEGLLINENRTSENVIIKNTKIYECRRNGLAVIDANGVTIDNCQINDTGKGEQAFNSAGDKIFSSAGTLPRAGIDLEALRYINDDGTMNEINRVEDVTIKNSNFKGNAGGDVDLYTATDVKVHNNFFDSNVGSFASNHVLIKDNVFEAADPDFTFAISVNSYLDKKGNELNYNYTITGNTIRGYRNGINLSGKNHEVFKNNVMNCVTGLLLKSLSDSKIYSNRYISALEVSYGINPFPNTLVDNVSITNEFIDVTNRPINLRGLNSESTITTNQITFENCEFYTKFNKFTLYIKDSKNLTIKNSKMNTEFEKINTTNVIVNSNELINR